MSDNSAFDSLPADVKPQTAAYPGYEHTGSYVFCVEYQKLYVDTEQALKAKGPLKKLKKVQKRVDKQWFKMHPVDKEIDAAGENDGENDGEI
ncbi:uncharacterized protein RHOBADRAFT_47047 [Rhodotorula graminis WP1]|uniref:Uncharacterized protein n=1 Tax=Rhodotorula graminis (strain WP1) TaxID=578459 RepID=A0A0P9EFR8_RHOGW|nr:uncharacterized protein RHOBADRAFT_47047 [Rhodotorula graminis WP1]KPV72202.1 hypothetical protein RHOBADRAFT_47047 [Rhodotorula graminis WP1]